jgi:hypothetical protein
LPTFRGLGSGGYDGFDWGNTAVLNEPFIKGCHSEMFKFERIPSIVDFLTSPVRKLESESCPAVPYWFRFLHKHAALLVPIGTTALIFLVVALLVAGFLPIPILSVGAPFVGMGLAAIVVFILLRF